MAHFPRVHSKVRAARVRVPNAEQFFLATEAGKVHGVLQKLSLTGGCAQLPRSYTQSTLAEITLQTRLGPVVALVEMLGQVSSGTSAQQAFRFIALSDGDHFRLSQTLRTMAGYGLAEETWKS